MHRLRWTLVAAVTLFGGCLFSSTRVFEFDVLGNANLATPLRVSASQHGEARIELIRARAYEESRNDIETVDRAGFAATLRSPSGGGGTLSVYLGDVAGLTDPAREALPLLTIPVSPEGREYSFADSEDELVNLGALREAIENGEFHLYLCASPGSDVEVEALLLVVAMTVEP